jgi:predicted HAD superfamily phosphohydrolase YqeG
MNHVLYGLISGHRQRRVLGRLLKAAPELATADVDLSALRADGVRALVFDFDGVLAPHAAAKPLDETVPVLQQALRVFGAGNVYILSNKPSAERLAYFKEYFPHIVFIGGVRKKPYPDGLQKIAALGRYAPEQIALLDDRLMTGALACLHSGSRFVYISKPLADFSRHPFKETFFAFLRFSEVVLARFAA